MVANIPKSQQGFILAAILWTLAVMFIAVGIFSTYVQRKLAIGLQAKAHMQQTLDSLSTEQSVLYLLGTSRFTLSGMSFSQLNQQDVEEQRVSTTAAVGDELWMDGTVYQGIGDTYFSLQDNDGLVSLNAPDESPLDTLLSHFESDKGQRARLVDCLQDYVDADNLIRMSGAEKDDYLQRGMLPPTNDFLRAEPELWRVMGWPEWLAKHPDFDVQNWLSIRRIGVINLNTMPAALLKVYLGLSDQLTNTLLQERKTNPFHSVEDFVTRTGLLLNLNEEAYRFLPSNEVRIRFWNKRGGQAKLISLQLTPNGLMGPWLVDYEYSVQSINNNDEALAIRQSTLFGHPLGDDRRAH